MSRRILASVVLVLSQIACAVSVLPVSNSAALRHAPETYRQTRDMVRVADYHVRINAPEVVGQKAQGGVTR
jgi:hypothetical protein